MAARPEKMLKVLFVSERSEWAAQAWDFVRARRVEAEKVLWSRGDDVPDAIFSWSGDWIVSFKSDLILPPATLSRARIGAINFHPAPPCYRGIGGSLWAIMNRDASFAVTCHHLTARIDSGPIVDVSDVPVLPGDSAETLKRRADEECLRQFKRIFPILAGGGRLPVNSRKWQGRLYTFAEWRRHQPH